MIVQVMQQASYDMRLVCGDRWLVYDKACFAWEVYERKYQQKNTRTIIITTSLQGALKVLQES
jgi:hypothetical protein